MRDLILNNFWYKALSLVLATLIWYVVESNLKSESKLSPALISSRVDNTLDLRCPVTVVTSATDRRLLSIQPTEVRVKVLGYKVILDKLSAADIHVYVKLTGLVDPEGTFPLSVDLPGNVLLQQISPDHVVVKSINSTNF